jgi:type IV pilus assembly protein PilC
MGKISQSQLAKMFGRLSTSYSAGIDIRRILTKEMETGSASYRQRAKQVAEGVSAGKSLAESMREVDGYFPELAISVVHAGERGGRLEESFARLAKHYNNLVSFRNKLLASLAWPLFELFFAIMIVGGLMALCDFIFVQIGKEPINWLWMGSTSGNVVAYFVLVGMLLTGAFVFFRGVSLGWFGETPMKIARRIPLIGKTIENLALSRFAWAMSVAENAGMNPIEVAQLSLNSTENYYYKQHEPKVSRMLMDGKSFYKSLKATGAFPEDLLIYVDNGETAGELAEAMDRASHEYQEKADLNLKLIGTIGFVLTLLFVGLMVLIIVVFAMSQYVNMLQSFSEI